METKKCKKCGKVIEGLTERHASSMMKQHMFKHENEEEENARRQKGK